MVIGSSKAPSVIGGYVSKVASAEGGYDIPAGVDPITQLHEKETVLPARQTEVIRGLADEGCENGPGQAGGALTVNIHAIDARGIADMFRQNAPAKAKALQGYHANR